MRQLNFRHKVLLLAIALVMAIELLTLFPVLNVIKRDVDAKAQRSVDLAGLVFEEFIRNRAAQLRTTAGVLVADFGFKQAAAGGDQPTIRSALANHSTRVGATAALLLDLDGEVIASSREGGERFSAVDFPRHSALIEGGGISHDITILDGVPFETVTVPLRAPTPIAWVMLGFPINDELAAYIRSLTGLHASFLLGRSGEIEVAASTLPGDRREQAALALDPSSKEGRRPAGGSEFLTELRRFPAESGELYVALQLPMSEITASYRRISGILIVITGISLLFAICGAVWLANRVTRPVHIIAQAARRMQQGIYTEAVTVSSTDEIGELAAGFNAMQEAIADRERAIFRIAHYDALTGLPNRGLIVDRLREVMDISARLTVVSLVPNRFSRMISTLGQRAGDEVIRLVANLLSNNLRENEVLGHLSDQEFVLILPGYHLEQTVDRVAHIADLLRAGITVSGANISLLITAGVASYPEHSKNAAELLRFASVARNEAQLRVEPTVIYSTEQEGRALEQIRIVGDFPGAIRNNELELAFQPKISCSSNSVIGAEALVRWRHPELGLLMPDAFVDAIEQSGGIPHLTRWVLKESVAQCARWHREGLALSVAVNISVDDLVDEYLPHFLLDITRRNGLKPPDVTLEVTESAIMHKIHMSLSVMSCMRELGFRVAIDDFGTGQSALAQLKRLPLDELKIDKSFVMNLETERDEAIVRASVELAHQFGLTVVAEGVENADVLERLRALSCEVAQGYYISRPLPANEFGQWVRSWPQTNNRNGPTFSDANRRLPESAAPRREHRVRAPQVTTE